LSALPWCAAHSEKKPEGHEKTMELSALPWCAAHQSQPAIMTYGEAADAAAGVGQPTTVKVCAKGNDMPGAVRKRLRTKSPDPDWCLPLNSVATQNAKRNDERSLTPARRLRQCSKSPSPSFAKQENSQDETNPTPARRLRRRSISIMFSCCDAMPATQERRLSARFSDASSPSQAALKVSITFIC